MCVMVTTNVQPLFRFERSELARMNRSVKVVPILNEPSQTFAVADVQR